MVSVPQRPERVVARPREVVDYALARRALLTDLFGGRAASLEVCDAHPYLLRAARYHGEPTDVPCPVCQRGQGRRQELLTQVTYVYADDLGAASGRPRPTRDLARLARLHELHVYVVEVCQVCAWNHLVTSYLLGETAPEQATPGGRRRRSGSRSS